jgi:hypothetical protein
MRHRGASEKMGLTVAALVAALGCTPGQMMEREAATPEAQFGRELLEKLFAGLFEPVLERFVPEAKPADLDKQLHAFVVGLPHKPPVRVRLIGFHALYQAGAAKQVQLTFEWEYSEASVLASIGLQGQVPDLQVYNLTVQRLTGTLEHLNALTLAGKPGRYWAFVIAAVVVVAFILFTAVLWWRTPGLRRRWLWLALVLLGTGKLSLNWTTGQITTQPISVQLLGVGLSRAGAYGPWDLSVAVPGGAIVFLIVRRGRRRGPTLAAVPLDQAPRG